MKNALRKRRFIRILPSGHSSLVVTTQALPGSILFSALAPALPGNHMGPNNP